MPACLHYLSSERTHAHPKEKSKGRRFYCFKIRPFSEKTGRGFVRPPQGADRPPPSKPATAGRSHFKYLITPPLVSERYIQTISNLCHAALLRRCELNLPYKPSLLN
jgi:hypothetical protein